MRKSQKRLTLWEGTLPMRTWPRSVQMHLAVVRTRASVSERTMNDSICKESSHIGASLVRQFNYRDLEARNGQPAESNNSRSDAQWRMQGVRNTGVEILARHNDVSGTGGEQFRPLSFHLSGLAFAQSGAQLHQDRGEDLVPGRICGLMGRVANGEDKQCH
jgi:hypothetical protein